jgi:hypothetical protein
MLGVHVAWYVLALSKSCIRHIQTMPLLHGCFCLPQPQDDDFQKTLLTDSPCCRDCPGRSCFWKSVLFWQEAEAVADTQASLLQKHGPYICEAGDLSDCYKGWRLMSQGCAGQWMWYLLRA